MSPASGIARSDCYTKSARSFRYRRGFVVAALLIAVLGVTASGVIVDSSVAYFADAAERAQKETDENVRGAKDALLNYMLLRAENPIRVTSGSSPRDPRFLMLLCPDNVGDVDGDNVLDGTQDLPCGAKGSGTNIVNDILNSGSRFGRLPWKAGAVVVTTSVVAAYDGLDRDAYDSWGNRLWFILSRNMAPNLGSSATPLNFHRLATKQEEWLSVVNQHGATLNTQVAAVILAPGKLRHKRLDETKAISEIFEYPDDVTGTASILNPKNYFEEYTSIESVSLTTTIAANYDKDGVFVDAPPNNESGFNDSLEYVTLDELMSPSGFFFPAYRQLVGISEIHNQPIADRPLAHVQEALDAYYNLFDFYPLPANLTITTHVDSRQRHCAAYHSGGVMITNAILPTGMTVTAPTAVTVHAEAMVTTDMITVSITVSTAFLLTDNAELTFSSPIDIVYNEMTMSANTVTLARYTRITMTIGFFLATVTNGLQSLDITTYRVSAGASLELVSAATVIVPPESPLLPAGNQFGWLAENTAPSMRAADNGDKLNIRAETKAAFFSGVVLTNTLQTVTISAMDILTLPAGGQIQLQQRFIGVNALDGIIHYVDGREEILAEAVPTEATYNKRQFVVWLLTDAIIRNSVVEAPAVLFPWRYHHRYADRRDNLQKYPPCFDSRNFFDSHFRLFLEDQPMIYAVAAACHYGGDPTACGRTAGLTVNVAADAVVALPQAATLIHSFTVSVSGIEVTVHNGELENSNNVSISVADWLPVIAGGQTVASFFLAKGTILTTRTKVIFPATTPLRGGTNSRFEAVPALLIYSPAPLPRVPCAAGMTRTTYFADAAVTLASQFAPAQDISNPCYWLDDAENADGNGMFTIYPMDTSDKPPQISPRNDYFLLFGGRLRI